MLCSLSIDDCGVIHMDHEGQDLLVEPFDKPYVARQVHLQGTHLQIQLPHQVFKTVDLSTLCVDEWDRFHGLTDQGIPFVLSHCAQAELFNRAENFTDHSIQIAGQVVETPAYYFNSETFNKKAFWADKYKENPSPPWNLDEPHPCLSPSMDQLKLNKCRILVPGCGFGHDAALLAQRGHIVTAIDISDEALRVAKDRYGHLKNLNFVKADILALGEEYKNQFDMIFEHTFYCAISPDKRSDLIKLWKHCLAETGHLLGLFFVVPKRTGPYFGGSEWELREKLKEAFNFLYWTRVKDSPGWRKGSELMVYAQIKEAC